MKYERSSAVERMCVCVCVCVCVSEWVSDIKMNVERLNVGKCKQKEESGTM
jgi:hypothetical protein